MIAPDDFIPIAEQSGQIVPIGRWVIGEACRQAAAWRAEGLTEDDSLMSVNLSPVQLTHTEIVTDVAAALARHGLPARVLCLEVIESAVMLDPDQANPTLAALKSLGCAVGQGFVLGRPAPPELMAEALVRRRAERAALAA